MRHDQHPPDLKVLGETQECAQLGVVHITFWVGDAEIGVGPGNAHQGGLVVGENASRMDVIDVTVDETVKLQSGPTRFFHCNLLMVNATPYLVK